MTNNNTYQAKSAPPASAHNAYLYHVEQDCWNDIQVYQLTNQYLWRLFAIVALVSLVIVSVVAIYYMNQDKSKTLVFERDARGNVNFLGVAAKEMVIDNKLIAHQLANFIIALREVPAEITLKRRNIDLVHKMTANKIHDYVDKLIIGQYVQAKNNYVFVTINSIKPLTEGKSWEIRWRESNDNSTLASHWSAVISFSRINVSDSSIALINPAGIIVNYINVSEDIDDKAM